MAETTVVDNRPTGMTVRGLPVNPNYRYLTAAELPPLMPVPPEVDAAPYRYPILQFIADWNRAPDQAALVAEAPFYDGDDPILLPAIAVIVHALAGRAGVPVPDWVFDHRAPRDVMLFGYEYGGKYALWVRQRSLDVCAFHQVWFHPRTLDKGTPDWWFPWD